MRDPRERVSGLADTLHGNGRSFFSVSRPTSEHTYGKQVHEGEIRVLGYEHGGVYTFLRRVGAKVELYFLSRYSRDKEAREMARKTLAH